jgi:transposase
MAHSTKSYSDDLRMRVVEARLSGKSVLEVAALFQVSRDCVRRWVIQYQETGSYSSHRRRGGHKKPKIRDMEKFEAFARVHAHSTLARMQAQWEEEVSLMCLSRALKRLGWTRKKSTTTTANATKRSARRS